MDLKDNRIRDISILAPDARPSNPLPALAIPSLATSTSTPVSPGISPTTKLFAAELSDHPQPVELEPPARPQSTPFSRLECVDSTTASSPSNRNGEVHATMLPSTDASSSDPDPYGRTIRSTFETLPIEIHDHILHHLCGFQYSTRTKVSNSIYNRSLRHGRRKELTAFALINKSYSELVQGRIFQHIKIKGTRPVIQETLNFLCDRPRLSQHIKHVEIWFPMWETREETTPQPVAFLGPLSATEPVEFLASQLLDIQAVNHRSGSMLAFHHRQASRNATLYEAFQLINLVCPNAIVLSLEGGHCKKPAMVKHCLDGHGPALPVLYNIRTIVVKSAWNIIRSEEHFSSVTAALPNLQEWRCAYAKPKSKVYLNVSKIAPLFPASVRHIDLSVENSYSMELTHPPFWNKVVEKTHICTELAKVLPRLESFTYSGRLCHKIFHHLMALLNASSHGNTSLKNIDITLKNCCRSASDGFDGTGIHNFDFIKAFESLVLAAIQTLPLLKGMERMRFRFIDLESRIPLLNPFFEMRDDQCTGLWSPEILEALARHRPSAKYVELAEEFDGVTVDKDGIPITGMAKRPLSMKVANYAMFSSQLVIH